jgi:biopolymer transport protein ExbB/TolQ
MNNLLFAIVSSFLTVTNSNGFHSVLIWLVVGIIVFLQMYFAYNTFKSIRELKGIFPDRNQLFTLKKSISGYSDTGSKEKFNIQETPAEQETADVVTLIGSRVECNSIMKEILHSTNTYLLRNKGAVADFNLIRDITDRNIDSLEEEIDSTLPVPLYLGLAGTMLGIIIGLLGMPQIASEDFMQGAGLDVLIGGVKIAMFSTLAGLVLTIFNTSIEFKKSKAKTEKRKNDYFTFIQTELLPVLTENAAGSIYTLDKNLKGFNQQFSLNTAAFAGIMHDVGDSLKSQKALYKQIESSDIPGLASNNLKLFKKFEDSATSLEKFGFYLDRISILTENSGILLEKTGKILENSDTISEIASAIKTNVHESNRLIKFIESHFSELEGRKEIIQKSVSEVDSILRMSLENLKSSTESTIEQMRRFTEEELRNLESAFQKNTTALERLNLLPQLQNELGEISKEIKGQGHELRSLLIKINESILALPARLPLHLKDEQDRKGQVIKAFKHLYYVSGALVFTGICIYTSVFLFSYFINWILDLIK